MRVRRSSRWLVRHYVHAARVRNGVVRMSRYRAMVLDRPRAPLREELRELHSPGRGQVLIRVLACGVCRTDLHLVDGELPEPALPIVPGHEVVGRVEQLGEGVTGFAVGARVGIPWLGYTCGQCEYCARGRENLCARARFTGYQLDGGYAEYALADARFCFPIPDRYSDLEAAPLLCAGLIGHRTLSFAEDARTLGIYGFGAAAHLITQVATAQGRTVFAFTRPGDVAGQRFARELGAEWACDSTAPPPRPLDAALIFAPVGALIPAALAVTVKGGTVISGGIHMSDVPSFPYALLWGERSIRSVANLTRRDAVEFLALAAKLPLNVRIRRFPLSQANEALEQLRRGAFEGAAVLVP